jgi:hypothetical protein
LKVFLKGKAMGQDIRGMLPKVNLRAQELVGRVLVIKAQVAE